MNNLPIFVLGDSHATWSFTINGINYPKVTYSYRTATPFSWTMHRVGRDSIDFTSFGLPKESLMILAYGWIDIHYHIEKQINKGRNEDEIINTLINKFITVIIGNRNKGQKHIGIMSIIPPVFFDDLSIYYPTDLNGPSRNELTLRFTQKMNALLKQKCIEFNLLYLNLHDAYVNDDGSLKKELSDDNVHLKTFIHHDKCFEEMFSSYTNFKIL